MAARPVLSLITDEVSEDLDTSIAFAVAHGIPLIDIRSVDGKSALLHNDASLDAMVSKVRAAGLRVSCFCSPLLKWPKAGAPVPEGANFHGFSPDAMPQDRAIARAFEVAERLGTQRIRIFSYLGYPDFQLDDLADDLEHLLSLARMRGVTLLMENEFVCNLRTLGDLAACRTRFDDPHLLGALDLCNQVTAGLGQPSEHELTAAGKIAGALHIKDTTSDGTYVTIGQGIVETRNALATILANAPTDELPICLETHMPHDGATATAQAIAALRELF
jgi:sugar phosphate isomerase/epimerase